MGIEALRMVSMLMVVMYNHGPRGILSAAVLDTARYADIWLWEARHCQWGITIATIKNKAKS